MQKLYTVWVWYDAQDVPRYVGYDRYEGAHPALHKWRTREEDMSEVGLWLQSLREEPRREHYGPQIMSRDTALAAVAGLRSRFRETLLRSRDPITWQGGHPAKPVFYFDDADVEQSRVYDSVREAARNVGANPSTVLRWCRSDKHPQWGYLV